jgi:hypothetical protein
MSQDLCRDGKAVEDQRVGADHGDRRRHVRRLVRPGLSPTSSASGRRTPLRWSSLRAAWPAVVEPEAVDPRLAPAARVADDPVAPGSDGGAAQSPVSTFVSLAVLSGTARDNRFRSPHSTPPERTKGGNVELPVDGAEAVQVLRVTLAGAFQILAGFRRSRYGRSRLLPAHAIRSCRPSTRRRGCWLDGQLGAAACPLHDEPEAVGLARSTR